MKAHTSGVSGHGGGEKQQDSGMYSEGGTNMMTKIVDVGYERQGK